MRGAIAAALVLAVATPGAAQTSAECAAFWDLASDLVGQTRSAGPVDRPAIRVGPGGCVASDIRLDGGPRTEFRIARIAWSGTGFDRMLADGLPPTSLKVSAKGIRVIPRTGQPVFDYAFGKQSIRGAVDLEIAASWDATAKALTLETLELDFPAENRIGVSATLEGIDLTDRDSIEASAATAAITEAFTRIETRGLFESYVLMALAPALLTEDEDPEAQVQALKVRANTLVGIAPSALLPQASKDALRRLISVMPNPNGTLAVRMTASPGLGTARGLDLSRNFVPDNFGDLWRLLDGVRLDVSYDHESLE